jgi:subtilase family serine protease
MTLREIFGVTGLLFISTIAFGKPLHLSLSMDHQKSHGTESCIFPDGTTLTNFPEAHCYTPDQVTKAYGIDVVHGLGVTGKGQTIVIVDAFGSPTIQQDLDHFSDTFGLPRTTIQFIYPNGPVTNPLDNSDNAGWAVETTLDVEWTHTMAPDASIVMVVTDVSETTGLAGFPEIFQGLQMAIDQHPGSVVSMSFATDELTFQSSEVSTYLQGSFHKILEEGARKNMTFLSGSGDWGSVNFLADGATYQSVPTVNYPASDPFVTGVGGTWLQSGWRWTPEGTIDNYWDCQLNKNCGDDFLKSVDLDATSEAVWNEQWANAASGGGVSTVFPMPKFQKSVGEANLKTMNGFRGVPDVAMNASVDGGVMIYSSFVSPAIGATGPAWSFNGGTSLATPETAGVVALAGELASSIVGRKVGVGYLNPILYSLSSDDFNDIIPQTYGGVTVGDNALYFNATVLASVGSTSMPPIAVPGYPVTEGYDLATGWGSPKGFKFVSGVARSVVERERFFFPRP